MAFTVQSRLGRGRTVETFAAVLEVGQERLDVVVKRPRPEYGKNAAFQDALEAWGNQQKKADHEHLVCVLEAGRTPDGVYVIQEKVEGAAVATMLKVLRRRKRTLKPAFALIIAEQVSQALAYLHRDLGIAHGGIDPGEVLVGYSGDVKLGDQRLHELDHHMGGDLLDQDDRSDYLAPERIRGDPASARSDLYAFALLVLEMLIGHPVWMAESMTVEGTLNAVRDFSPVGQAAPELTKELVEELGRCLETRHDKRPLNAVPVAAALAALNKRHGISPDGAGLGKFVEALVPPPEAEDAPTMMVDAAFAEEVQRKHEERILSFEGASVAIDPEIERQAGLPKRVLPLVGQTVELGIEDTVSPTALEPETVAPSDAKTHIPPRPSSRDPSASPTRKPSAAPVRSPSASPQPVAPSVRREVAVPAVHRVAAKASSEFDASQRRLVLIAAAALVVIAIAVIGALSSGGEAQRIRLRATSVPTGANVYDVSDERLLGQAPVEVDVTVSGELLKLRFELDGHEPHKVSIGSESGEIRYEAKMKALGTE